MDRARQHVPISPRQGANSAPTRANSAHRSVFVVDMGIFSEIFSWWGGNTWSNRLYTAVRGRLVGEDAAGNRYYVQKKGTGPLGVPRRWVIYRDLAEASQVPPEWHGWLHYMVDTPPTEEAYAPRAWQKPHRANLTGSPQAWRPPGSILASGRRPQATGDYKPWRPK